MRAPIDEWLRKKSRESTQPETERPEDENASDEANCEPSSEPAREKETQTSMKHAQKKIDSPPAAPPVVGVRHVDAVPTGPLPVTPLGFVPMTRVQARRMQKVIAVQRERAEAFARELEATPDGTYYLKFGEAMPKRGAFIASLRLASGWEAAAVAHEQFTRYARSMADNSWDAVARHAKDASKRFTLASDADSSIAKTFPAGEKFCRAWAELGTRAAVARLQKKAQAAAEEAAVKAAVKKAVDAAAKTEAAPAPEAPNPAHSNGASSSGARSKSGSSNGAS